MKGVVSRAGQQRSKRQGASEGQELDETAVSAVKQEKNNPFGFVEAESFLKLNVQSLS